jgi:hypothetical protein
MASRALAVRSTTASTWARTSTITVAHAGETERVNGCTIDHREELRGMKVQSQKEGGNRRPWINHSNNYFCLYDMSRATSHLTLPDACFFRLYLDISSKSTLLFVELFDIATGALTVMAPRIQRGLSSIDSRIFRVNDHGLSCDNVVVADTESGGLRSLPVKDSNLLIFRLMLIYHTRNNRQRLYVTLIDNVRQTLCNTIWLIPCWLFFPFDQYSDREPDDGSIH